MNQRKEQLYSSFIEENAEIWSSRAKKIRSAFGTEKRKALLDVGCGDGGFTLALQECSEELWGVDISEKAVSLAKQRGIRAFQVDIDEAQLPFQDNAFDIVFCGEVIEHVFDVDHLLEEIQRVLRPGGIAVVTTPNLASWINRFVLLFGFQPYLTGTGFRYGAGKLFSKSPCPHLQVFTYRALQELLGYFGFQIVQTWGEPFPGMPFPLGVGDAIISKVPSLAVQLVFVVKKPL